MNKGKFDGGQSTEEEKSLRNFYKRLLNIAISNDALTGESREIHYYNKEHTKNYNHRVFSFVRFSKEEKLIVVTNFDTEVSHQFELRIPQDIISLWGLSENTYELEDLLYQQNNKLILRNGEGFINVSLAPLESFIFKL